MTAKEESPAPSKAEARVKYSNLTKSTSEPDSSLSIWSLDYWQDQFDQQRLQRLQQCHSLQQTLKACEGQHGSRPPNSGEDPVPSLDQYGGGIRMLRYYGWREGTPLAQRGCIPEKHAMWTCRAISLACGSELRNMRDCFQEAGTDAILSTRQTAYEVTEKSEAKKASIPCFDMQRALGHCVATNARKLEEKIKHRKQQLKQRPKSE